MSETKYLIGVDPGKATGLALISYSDEKEPVLLDHTTVSEGDVVATLRTWVYNQHPVELVVERFVLRGGVHGVDITPERINGRIMQFAEESGLDVVWQLASGKDLISNDVLKRMDFWVPGKDNRHVDDALRHVMQYLVHLRNRPAVLKGFP